MTFFGHPLHPLTVHFPIAFYILGVALTMLYIWRKEPAVGRFANWCLILSLATALFSSLVGLVDQSRLGLDDARRSNVNSHITAGIILLIINALLIYMHLRWPDVLSRYRWQYIGLMLLGLVALLATAWLGGQLVYRWQVGVL